MTAHETGDGRILVTDLSGLVHLWERGCQGHPIFLEDRGQYDHDVMPGEALLVARALL